MEWNDFERCANANESCSYLIRKTCVTLARNRSGNAKVLCRMMNRLTDMIREGGQQDGVTDRLWRHSLLSYAPLLCPHYCIIKLLFFLCVFYSAFCEVIVLDPWEVNYVHCCDRASLYFFVCMLVLCSVEITFKPLITVIFVWNWNIHATFYSYVGSVFFFFFLFCLPNGHRYCWSQRKWIRWLNCDHGRLSYGSNVAVLLPPPPVLYILWKGWQKSAISFSLSLSFDFNFYSTEKFWNFCPLGCPSLFAVIKCCV